MSQLSKGENAKRIEERAARQWLRRHEGEGTLPPRRRLESGESAFTEQSDYLRDVKVRARRSLSNVTAQAVTANAEEGDGTGGPWEPDTFAMRPGPGSPSGYSMLEDGPDQRQFQPIWDARPLTSGQVEVAARLAHVFSFLRPDRADLIRERYIFDGGRTLEDIAEGEGVSRQAIAKRLKLAVRDFEVAYGAHFADDIEWAEE